MIYEKFWKSSYFVGRTLWRPKSRFRGVQKSESERSFCPIFQHGRRSRSNLLAAFVRSQIGLPEAEIWTSRNRKNRLFQIFVKIDFYSKFIRNCIWTQNLTKIKCPNFNQKCIFRIFECFYRFQEPILPLKRVSNGSYKNFEFWSFLRFLSPSSTHLPYKNPKIDPKIDFLLLAPKPPL